MKFRNNVILSVSSVCLILLGAQFGSAQDSSQSTANLVPAEVWLTKSLDARKDQPGASFEARLKSTVHLKNGTELPQGTLLEGTVVADQSKSAGASQLALRFTNAKLKGGKLVPIEATIVGLAEPALGTDSNSSYDGPTPWNGTTTLFDMTGALNNIDLHSKIGADNSGTLVASGKSALKLSSGSRLSLALGDKSSN